MTEQLSTASPEDILSWNFVETEKHNIISLWKVFDAISKKNEWSLTYININSLSSCYPTNEKCYNINT